MLDLLTELAIIIMVAALLGIIAKLLKQPTILAYIATGVIVGSYQLFELHNRETWTVFADLGIMFLLFLVGLEINYSSLKKVGKHAALIGIGQVVFTFIVGFLIIKALGIASVPAIYIAIGLTFSSTIIIVKLLSEKKDLSSLYGKLSIGFLLIQDLIVILILIIVSGIGSGNENTILTVFLTLIKAVILFGIMLLLGRHVLPRVFDSVAGSSELLFIISLAWGFAVVSLVKFLGFSIEIGGFLAGLSLANSAEHWEIGSRVKTLRDFFLVMFFALLGSTIAFENFGTVLLPIVLLSLFVLIGNPLIVLIIMGSLGYTKRTAFFSGITVAQVSEFSLVLAALGLSIGHLAENHIAIVTGVAIITIVISTYMVSYSERLYSLFSPYLSFFERKHINEKKDVNEIWSKRFLLFGCKRVGQGILAALPKKDVLVVDFDPDMIERLKSCKYDYIFDDMADPELFDKMDVTKLELVISAAPGFEENSALLEKWNFVRKEKGISTPIVVRADDEEEAKIFYEQKADYVILPYITSGHYLGKTIERSTSMDFLHNLRFRDQQLMHKDSCWILK